MNYLFFNPLSNNGNGEEEAKIKAKALEPYYSSIIIKNVLEADQAFFKKLKEKDVVILCGGDGTLNHFVNQFDTSKLPCDFYFLESGTGNDFVRDTKKDEKTNLVYLNEYLKKLPTVFVNGKSYHFVNGIGFGIDGECCAEAERLKAQKVAKIDYASITVKLLLTKYIAPRATVKIDGKEYSHKKVYLASTMFGKYYGGGMEVAPKQDRLGDTFSFVAFSGKGRIISLMAFPSIFKGELVNKKKMCQVYSCHQVEVIFDHPTALQIDGEVIENVLTYKAVI